MPAAAAALCSGCAAGPAVHRVVACSSGPGTAASGPRTEGSPRRRRCRPLPSCHAVHPAGTIAAAAAAVHGDASLPGSW